MLNVTSYCLAEISITNRIGLVLTINGRLYVNRYMTDIPDAYQCVFPLF